MGVGGGACGWVSGSVCHVGGLTLWNWGCRASVGFVSLQDIFLNKMLKIKIYVIIKNVVMKYVTVARYDAGDHVAVYPTNDPELVEKLGGLLDVDLDAVISLNNTDGEKIV